MPRTSNYIPSLDGWRALSIVGVILFHIPDITLFGHSLRPLQNFGVYGVETFFVISGLLICTRLLQEEQQFGRISLKGFYLRRLFRIQPAALVYLLVLLLLAAAAVIPLLMRPWWMALLAARSYYPKPLWFAPGALYTNHFWSLAVEEHFYLVLPLMLVFIPRRLRLKALGAVYAVSFLWARIAAHKLHLADNRTDVSFELLMLPALLAVVLWNKPSLRNAVKGWPLVVFLLALFAVIFADFRFAHQAFATPMIQVLILSAVFGTTLLPESWPTSVLELAPLRYMGRISYSLYLWQQIFCMAPSEGGAMPGLARIQGNWLGVVATLACAVVSFYLIERPLIRLGHRLAPSPAANGRELDNAQR